MTTSNVKEIENKNPSQRTTRSTFRSTYRSTIDFPHFIEMGRINSYIVKARSQNGNTTIEALIEAAEQYAKFDGILDEVALEKMREMLRKDVEVKRPESFWADGIPRLEAAIAVQAQLNAYYERDNKETA